MNYNKWWADLDDVWKKLYSINHVVFYTFDEKFRKEYVFPRVNPFQHFKHVFFEDFHSYKKITQTIYDEILALPMFYAADCNLTSISPISTLKKLRKVDFSFNPIDNFSPLNLNDNLEELNIEETRIRTLSFCSKFKQLKILLARANNIKQIAPLLALKELCVLDISYSDIEDIELLKGMFSLKEFYCSGGNIKEGIFLEGMKNLEILDLSYNKIEQVQFIFNLPKLSYADIFQNPFNENAYNWETLTEKGIELIKGNDDIEETVIFYD